jgi:hypothetical protein
LLLLLGGVLVYWWMKPPGSQSDHSTRSAAEAFALVQTHRAAGYPTILQAFNERARIQEDAQVGACAWVSGK